MAGGFNYSREFYGVSDVDRLQGALGRLEPGAFQECENMVRDITRFLEQNIGKDSKFPKYIEDLKMPVQFDSIAELLKDIVFNNQISKLGSRKRSVESANVSQGQSFDTESDSDSAEASVVGSMRKYVGLPIPSYWSRDLNLDLNNYNLTFLDKTSAEFLKIKRRFHETLKEKDSDKRSQVYGKLNGSQSIFEIILVENLKAWMHYQIQKLYMIQDIGAHLINEKYLFHGTKDKENIDSIIRNGFSKSAIGVHLYGNGLYFSPHAQYSGDYTAEVEPSFMKALEKNDDVEDKKKVKEMGDHIQKLRIMFFCRVLVGRENSIEANTHRRNYKDDLFPDDGYDSNVGSSIDKVHCVFNTTNAYPEYIILFRSGNIPNAPGSAEVMQSPTMKFDKGDSRVNLLDRKVDISFKGVDSMTNYVLPPVIPDTTL